MAAGAVLAVGRNRPLQPRRQVPLLARRARRRFQGGVAKLGLVGRLDAGVGQGTTSPRPSTLSFLRTPPRPACAAALRLILRAVRALAQKKPIRVSFGYSPKPAKGARKALE